MHVSGQLPIVLHKRKADEFHGHIETTYNTMDSSSCQPLSRLEPFGKKWKSPSIPPLECNLAGFCTEREGQI